MIGHQEQWQFLKKSAELDKLSHAYLFTGQDKLGKKRMAFEWASLLFGKDFRKDHPDLILIESEGEESKLSSSTLVKKKNIQVSQIRGLIWQLSLKPYSAPFKLAIIDQAHLMNQTAETCLLKTLEEPKGKTILILITAFPEYLFPTIISRVQTIQFQPVKKEEIRNYLKKENVPEKEAEEIITASLGRPGLANDFISNPDKLKNLYQKVKELDEIANSTLASRFQYAKNLSEDSIELKTTLDIWLSYFRKLLLSEPANLSVLNRIKRTQETLFLISTTNVNSKLALERLMLEF